jgi:hypothetical protein
MGGSVKAETAIQKAIKETLEEWGYLVRRVQSGSVRVRRGYMHLAEKGTGDLIVQGRQFTAWLEVKTEDGEQSEDQEQFEADVVRRGNIYLTARTPAEALTTVRALGGPV